MPDATLGKHRNSYVLVWYEEGKRIRRSLGTNDKAEADRLLAEFKYQQAEQTKHQSNTVSFLYEQYKISRIKLGKSTDRISFAWKSLSEEFGGLLPHQISSDRVHAWTAKRSLVAGVGTIHIELGYLRAALRWAAKEGYISSAPNVTLPTKPRPKTEYVPKDVFRSLLKDVRLPHVRLFLILAVCTGGRASALLDLTWDRVDFERKLINLDNPSRDRTSKGRAVVPMNATAEAELIEAKKGEVCAYVLNWGGNPIRSVRTAFRLLSERAGVKVTPHMLRHSAAVWMAEAGVPMAEISQFLGHTNTSVTERVYARFSPGYLQKAASALVL